MTVLAASSCSGVKVSDGCGPDGTTDLDGREDDTSEDGDNETGPPDPDTPLHDTSTEITAATTPTRHATIRLITQHLHWCHNPESGPSAPGSHRH